ncbi:hypothetical protein ebA2991 [Aromatoleum aromaticum EbN1]|uniref:Uncharacterized protein n=1 Tax=Aromatoleum aromaticum (strain DSM 19018 / LMG 30748 / EbN1) TaxID=76114 RepID=Q5P4F5_AROAE|nr:hypothetical protein ebA2991 [Aromatoleum aromaticum EbN1]
MPRTRRSTRVPTQLRMLGFEISLVESRSYRKHEAGRRTGPAEPVSGEDQ